MKTQRECFKIGWRFPPFQTLKMHVSHYLLSLFPLARHEAFKVSRAWVRLLHTTLWSWAEPPSHKNKCLPARDPMNNSMTNSSDGFSEVSLNHKACCLHYNWCLYMPDEKAKVSNLGSNVDWNTSILTKNTSIWLWEESCQLMSQPIIFIGNRVFYVGVIIIN